MSRTARLGTPRIVRVRLVATETSVWGVVPFSAVPFIRSVEPGRIGKYGLSIVELKSAARIRGA